MENRILVEQVTNAFVFMEKLFFETSFLIKEIEGQLKQEPEAFIIGRGKGYSVNAYNSTSLDNPEQWLYKSLCVFFAPKDSVIVTGGRTTTSFKEALKIIYLKIIFRDEAIKSPKLLLGVLYDISTNHQSYKRVEDVIATYYDYVFKWKAGDSEIREADYSDRFFDFKEKYRACDLMCLNSPIEVHKIIVTPVLDLYRGIGC